MNEPGTERDNAVYPLDSMILPVAGVVDASWSTHVTSASPVVTSRRVV